MTKYILMFSFTIKNGGDEACFFDSKDEAIAEHRRLTEEASQNARPFSSLVGSIEVLEESGPKYKSALL